MDDDSSFKIHKKYPSSYADRLESFKEKKVRVTMVYENQEERMGWNREKEILIDLKEYGVERKEDLVEYFESMQREGKRIW